MKLNKLTVTLGSLKVNGFTIGLQCGMTTQTFKGNVIVNVNEQKRTFEVFVRHAKEPCKGVWNMAEILQLDSLVNG